MKFGICLPIRRNTTIQFNIDLAIKDVSHLLFDPECSYDEQTYELIERIADRFIS